MNEPLEPTEEQLCALLDVLTGYLDGDFVEERREGVLAAWPLIRDMVLEAAAQKCMRQSEKKIRRGETATAEMACADAIRALMGSRC